MKSGEAIEILENAHFFAPEVDVDTAIYMAISALGSIEQIKKERDTAVDQLSQLGYGLGEDVHSRSKKNDLLRWMDVVPVIFTALLEDPDGCTDHMARAIAMAEEITPVRQWIPVEKALPEELKPALGWIERDSWGDGNYPKRVRECAVGWQFKGLWHFDGVTGEQCFAWMPLPSAYIPT